jgi:hypothetical protein
MSDRSDSGHLTPELFVDVLDGTPIDVSHKQHLEQCGHCRAELDELRGTLALITPNEAASLTADSRKRLWVRWLAAAAALLIATLGVYWRLDVSGEAAPNAAEIEAMLPPIEQDGEFQVLLTVAEGLDAEWDFDEPSAFESDIGLDPGEWTAAERRRFVEKLAEELRSSSS